MRPAILFAIVWIAWILSWAAASVWSAQIRKQVPWRDAWLYRLAVLAGAVLLYHRTAAALGAPRLWHVGYAGAYALLGVTVAGFLFAWWARIYLGALWSGSVTVKQDHRIVDTGPYRLVRHPIYTGLLISTLATATAAATMPALAGLGLIAVGLWLKARLEERFLAMELGADAYAAYRQRVPMLVPFLQSGS